MKNKIMIAALMGLVLGSDIAIGGKKIKAVTVPNIEIKGFQIGMPEIEAKNIIDRTGGITIADVYAEYYNLEYYEGKLDKFTFLFDNTKFDNVLGAVKEKYPSLKCRDSSVSNAMGASFNQTECNLISENAVLILNRRINVKTSSLIINSKRLLDELVKNKDKSKKDI